MYSVQLARWREAVELIQLLAITKTIERDKSSSIYFIGEIFDGGICGRHLGYVVDDKNTWVADVIEPS